jgi:hypothetical protein
MTMNFGTREIPIFFAQSTHVIYSLSSLLPDGKLRNNERGYEHIGMCTYP